MKTKFFLSLLFLVPAATAAASPLAVTTYYVDVAAGSNANSGTLPTEAFQSVNFAIGNATAGDTIKILPGVYSEQVKVTKDGLQIEALPTATFLMPDQAPPGWTAFEIDATLESITRKTVIRGFEILGSPIGVGIRAHNGGIADREVSPVIKNNRILGMGQSITIAPFGPGGGSTISRAHVEHNFVDGLSAVCSSANVAGIFFNPVGDAELDVIVEQNQVFRVEFGVGMFNQSTGETRIRSNSNVVSECEFGFNFGSGATSAIFTNETIAFGKPASGGQDMVGFTGGAGVSVFNSIVWVPDEFDCNTSALGVDLVGFEAGGATIDAASIVEDLGDPDPQFVDPTPDIWDFRLMRTSPAIDAGNTTVVAPEGLYPVDMDNRGQSRILAASMDHNFEVDVGAHEFTQLEFDVDVTGYTGYTGNGEPCVSARYGSFYTITLNGPSSGTAFLLISGPIKRARLISDMGYQLVAGGNTMGPVSLANGPASWSFFVPASVNPSSKNTLFYQARVRVPNATGPATGNFSRRIEVELNR